MRIFRLLDNQVEPIDQHSYRDEEIHGFGEVTLEEFLVDHPEVIPGEAINPDDPPRFAVVRSQAGVTAGSMDILMLDNHGVPTVVEAKLIDNREIRRSVLAQGFEYMAHIRSEWTPERFKDEGQTFWEQRERNFLEDASSKLGVELGEGYWAQVNHNLESSRLRLIIAADALPPQLARVIEFVNEGSTFDVFGLEVKLFVGGSSSEVYLVPSLVGATQRSRDAKVRKAGHWDKNVFLEVFEDNAPDTIGIALALYDFAKEISDGPVTWGTGTDRGSFTAWVRPGHQRHSLFSVYTTGQYSVNFGWAYKYLDARAEGLSERYRNEVRDRVGPDLSRKSWERGWPMADLTDLSDEATLRELKKLVKEFVAEVTELASDGGTE